MHEREGKMRLPSLIAVAGAAVALSACTYVERDRSPPPQSAVVVPAPQPQATVVTPAPQPAPTVTVRPSY
jgi:hypothetical protein